MQATPDLRLLRDYANRRDEAAFRELVARHTDLVYSAVLRQVESSAAAADLTQGVFTDLARKADALARGGDASSPNSLVGWLHRATRYAALNYLRDSRRRLDNERQAMQQLLTDSEPSAGWEQIRPALDEALDTLDDEDREVLLLRYFQNQDFRSVGLALGVSDDTAQKRASRAVEKLREFFVKRKITVGASGLVVLISANAVQAAPVGLVATISATALASTAVTTSTVIAATKTIAMTTLQKTLVTATVAVLAGTGIYEARQAAQLRDQVQTLQQQQAPLAEQIQKLQNNFAEVTNRLANLLAENLRLKANPRELELLTLRGKVAQLQNEVQQSAQDKAGTRNDLDAQLTQTLFNRLKQLKQAFEQSGTTIPEMQFLTEQDWLNTVANRELTNDVTLRRAMAAMRFAGKSKFAEAVHPALKEFLQSNNGQYPAASSELKPYLPTAMADFLDRYEIAGPGWVNYPFESPGLKESVKKWAMVEKGSFTPAGKAVPRGNNPNFIDQDYDMTIVIFKESEYGY